MGSLKNLKATAPRISKFKNNGEKKERKTYTQEEIYKFSLEKLWTETCDIGLFEPEFGMVYLCCAQVTKFFSDAGKDIDDRRYFGFANLLPDIIVGKPEDFATATTETFDVREFGNRLTTRWFTYDDDGNQKQRQAGISVGDSLYFHWNDRVLPLYDPDHMDIGLFERSEEDMDYPCEGDIIYFRLRGAKGKKDEKGVYHEGCKAQPWYSDNAWQKAVNDYMNRVEYRVLKVVKDGAGKLRKKPEVVFVIGDPENDDYIPHRYEDKISSVEQIVYQWEKVIHSRNDDGSEGVTKVVETGRHWEDED